MVTEIPTCCSRWTTVPPTPGNGSVVLSGLTFEAIPLAANDLISVIYPGDFDADGDVDGRDFLKWQRGISPTPFSQSDLTNWEANYGTVVPLSATSAAVPEPTTSALALAALCLAISRRRAF